MWQGRAWARSSWTPAQIAPSWKRCAIGWMQKSGPEKPGSLEPKPLTLTTRTDLCGVLASPRWVRTGIKQGKRLPPIWGWENPPLASTSCILTSLGKALKAPSPQRLNRHRNTKPRVLGCHGNNGTYLEENSLLKCLGGWIFPLTEVRLWLAPYVPSPLPACHTKEYSWGNSPRGGMPGSRALAFEFAFAVGC